MVRTSEREFGKMSQTKFELESKPDLRYGRKVLVSALFGWILDGYEGSILPITMAALLLGMGLTSAATMQAGVLLSLTLIGWAIGGILGGLFADKWGRKRVLIYSMLLYMVFSGLTFFAQSIPEVGVIRFLTGLGLGSEWASGAVLLSEAYPSHLRSRATSIMQSGYGWGQLLASSVWLVLSLFTLPGGNWRYAFLIGTVPAIGLLFIRRGIKESTLWQSNEVQARVSQTKFLRELFAPAYRKITMLTFVMASVSSFAFWGVASWIGPYNAILAKSHHLLNPQLWTALATAVYAIGAICGFFIFGYLAERVGRKKSIALYFLGGLITASVPYFITQPALELITLMVSGFFNLGLFAWLPTYLPELYPTLIRSTASGSIYNASRFIAAGAPFFGGYFISVFHSFAIVAAMTSTVYLVGIFVVTRQTLPETKGAVLESLAIPQY